MEKIFEFTVLHKDWELDNEGWIEKQDDGKLKLMTTNHNSICEMCLDEINEKITETEKSLNDLKKAKTLVYATNQQIEGVTHESL